MVLFCLYWACVAVIVIIACVAGLAIIAYWLGLIISACVAEGGMGPYVFYIESGWLEWRL